MALLLVALLTIFVLILNQGVAGRESRASTGQFVVERDRYVDG